MAWSPNSDQQSIALFGGDKLTPGFEEKSAGYAIVIRRCYTRLEHTSPQFFWPIACADTDRDACCLDKGWHRFAVTEALEIRDA